MSAHGTSVNSHTFISFTNAIQQTYAIQKALAALRPQDAAALQQNAGDYARRLRLIKSKAAQQLAEAKITRVVTVHDGYGYLLQEFGLEVAGVVQPAHGLTPSAAELRDMVKLLQREKIRVVFSEETFPAADAEGAARTKRGVKVYIITHIASGAYTADKFEREMQRNVDTMIRALVTEAMTATAEPAALLEIDAARRAPAPRGAARRRRRCACAAARVHVVVGPNGAGKSTLLSAILGQIAVRRTDRDELDRRRHDRLRAADVRRRSDAAGHGRRFSRAHPPAPAGLFRRHAAPPRPRSRGCSRASACRASSDRPLAVLSGGELRRVLLAHALDPEPELLILDEPTAGLDEAAIGDARTRSCWPLKRGGRTTVLMVSHDLDQVGGRRSGDGARSTVVRGPPRSWRRRARRCCRARRRPVTAFYALDRRRWRSAASCPPISSIRFWSADSCACWCSRRCSAA